jgi:hypothetical protein
VRVCKALHTAASGMAPAALTVLHKALPRYLSMSTEPKELEPLSTASDAVRGAMDEGMAGTASTSGQEGRGCALLCSAPGLLALAAGGVKKASPGVPRDTSVAERNSAASLLVTLDCVCSELRCAGPGAQAATLECSASDGVRESCTWTGR